jgi:hypothetical protein
MFWSVVVSLAVAKSRVSAGGVFGIAAAVKIFVASACARSNLALESDGRERRSSLFNSRAAAAQFYVSPLHVKKATVLSETERQSPDGCI